MGRLRILLLTACYLGAHVGAALHLEEEAACDCDHDGGPSSGLAIDCGPDCPDPQHHHHRSAMELHDCALCHAGAVQDLVDVSVPGESRVALPSIVTDDSAEFRLPPPRGAPIRAPPL